MNRRTGVGRHLTDVVLPNTFTVRTQTNEARSALRALLRESKFISFHTAVERGGKITMDQAVAVVKVRFACGVRAP